MTIADRVDDLQRTPFPGTGTVTLESGTRAIYYAPDGGTAAIGQPPDGLFADSVEVVPLAGSDPLPESIPGATIQISFPSLDGYEMLRVEVPRDGPYEVRASAEAGIAPGELAIGERVFGDTARTLVTAILGTLLGLLSLAGLIAIFFVRRSRRRRPDPGQLSSPGMEGLPPPPGEF